MQDDQNDEPSSSGPPHAKPTDPTRDHDHRPVDRPSADQPGAPGQDAGDDNATPGRSGTPAMDPDADVPPPRDPGEDALANQDNEALLKMARPPLGN